MLDLRCMSLALLFLASAVPTKAQEGGAGGVEARVVVPEGAPLSVECGLRVEQRAEWRRDGGAVPPDMRASEAAVGGRLTARLHAAAARPAHAGLYSCGREAAQRVRVVVQPAAAPAAAPAVHASLDAVPDTAVKSEPIIPITVKILPQITFKLGYAISLNCTSDVPADKVVWKKNGTEVEKLSDLVGRHELKGLTFEIAHAKEDDFGNYTCMQRDVSGVAGEWQLSARAIAKLPTDTNVVEGQKLKLQCKLVGKPYPPVTWTFTNQSDDSNATEVTALLGSRVLLKRSEQGVEFGELIVESAERGDAGVFTCTPQDGVPASTLLRVKDMYAALWPFLGICVEVFVLCAIILVYEKRRTKPEQDDSDTDNHDQKKS